MVTVVGAATAAGLVNELADRAQPQSPDRRERGIERIDWRRAARNASCVSPERTNDNGAPTPRNYAEARVQEMAVFTGTAHPDLAAEICEHLDVPLAPDKAGTVRERLH